jgi:hypothetical protein
MIEFRHTKVQKTVEDKLTSLAIPRKEVERKVMRGVIHIPIVGVPKFFTLATIYTKVKEVEDNRAKKAPISQAPHITIGTNTMDVDSTSITIDIVEDPFNYYGLNVYNLVVYNRSKNKEEMKDDGKEKKNDDMEEEKKKSDDLAT